MMSIKYFSLTLSVALLATSGAGLAQPLEVKVATPAILASYDFEEPADSGPDTFRLFEHARGRVDLSEAFRQRDLELAGELYRLLRPVPGFAQRALLKGASVAFLRGDLAAEKKARENAYGRLELEEMRAASGSESP